MKTTFTVQRYTRGWDSWQVLYKTWWVGKIPIWRTATDQEDIPSHIYIQWLTFGDWNGWESKFKAHIPPKV